MGVFQIWLVLLVGWGVESSLGNDPAFLDEHQPHRQPNLLTFLLPFHARGPILKSEPKRYLIIDTAYAGSMSSKMMVMASGVALAMVTQRTPVVRWKDVSFRDRFRDFPPHGMMDLSSFLHKSVPVDCQLQIGREANISNILPSCSVLRVSSRDDYVLSVLPFSVRGRPLGDWLFEYAPTPMGALIHAIFRPMPSIQSLLEHYINEVTEGNKTLITLHLDTEVLGAEEYIADVPSVVNSRIIDCGAAYARALGAELLFLASDCRACAKHARLRLRVALPSLSVLSLDNYTSFVQHKVPRKVAAHFLDDGGTELLDPEYADLLLLGRGSACVGTARSSFSRAASALGECSIVASGGAGCLNEIGAL